MNITPSAPPSFSKADRPMPGVSFSAAAPPSVGDLPRMDVTGFVGLAAAGPFDVPVLVEDELRFREIFGPDLELTPVGSNSAATHSLLGPSIEAFFSNGGRSCYVVRVGSKTVASTSRFLVPGLVSVATLGHPDGLTPAELTPTELQARCPGSHFDQFRAAAWVNSHRLAQRAPALGAEGGIVELTTRSTVAVGDLIEFRFDPALPDRSDQRLWVIVEEVAFEQTGLGADTGRTARWSAPNEQWLSRSHFGDRSADATALLVGTSRTAPLVVDAYKVTSGGGVALSTSTVDVDPVPGELVLIDAPGRETELFVVEQVQSEALTGTQALSSRFGWLLHDGPSVRNATGPWVSSRRLSLSVAAFDRDSMLRPIENLGFAAAADRWIGNLRSDHDLFDGLHRRSAARAEHPNPGPLDSSILGPRFPFAARSAGHLLPFGLADNLQAAVPGRALIPDEGALLRNGIDHVQPEWFYDGDLPRSPEALARTANRRFFVDGEGLRGADALIPLKEVAVISAPDAAHTGWDLVPAPPPTWISAPTLTADDPSDRLTWSPFEGPGDPMYILESSPAPNFGTELAQQLHEQEEVVADRPSCQGLWYRVRTTIGSETSPWSNSVLLRPGTEFFASCVTEAEALPVLTLDNTDPHDLRLEAEFIPPAVSGPVEFEQNVSSNPLFESLLSSVRYLHPDATIPLDLGVDRPDQGINWIRIRRLSEDGVGPWSNTVAVPAVNAEPIRVPRSGQAGQAAPVTVAIHRALSDLAASRQDTTVLVSFPDHYEAEHLTEHLAELRSHARDRDRGLSSPVDYLHAHHPWVRYLGNTGAAWIPADGAIAGRLAATASLRGPWIAAVQDPLFNVVGSRFDYGLEEALTLRSLQVNFMTRHNDGFRVEGVDTLSHDPAVLPVTVRRLLILLRRMAWREGHKVLFEDNGPLLWRILRTRFDALLGSLYRRGAFVGDTPDKAYRVICDAQTNPKAAVDAGQVVIELQIAPAHPLEFLVVRFVQSDAAKFEFARAA